jgi:oxygen-dependent protoporphyrinogen oxidase
MNPIVVIGGGITGLSAAYELVSAGRPVTLIEAGPTLGGVIRTETIDGCTIEAGPDSFIAMKPAAHDLITELGLGDQLIGSNDASRVTYIVRDGRLVPLPDGLMMMVPTRVLPVLRSPLLGFSTKLRMGLELFRRALPHAPDRSVADFVADHFGREAVDYLAEPLLSGVYGGDVARLSVESVLPRFVELERRSGSLTRGLLSARRRVPPSQGPLFLTLRGGLGQLTAALEHRIRPDCRILRASAVAITREQGHYFVRVRDESIAASGVIVACPAWCASSLVAPVHARLAELLGSIEYSSSITLSLGYRRERCGPIPPGFGFLVPARERGALVACTFVGAKFSHRVPDSHHVLRCFLGGAGHADVLEQPDSAILASVRAELKKLLKWDVEPDFYHLSRWSRAMAQYPVGHAARLAEIRSALTELPGLQLAGNAYDGIGVPDCIRTARQAARTLLAHLQ